MIYIDIDGTLTNAPGTNMGDPILHRIAHVKRLISHGWAIVIWSGSGHDYAVQFCEEHGLYPVAALGKPTNVIDDRVGIRPDHKPPWLTLINNGVCKYYSDAWLDQGDHDAPPHYGFEEWKNLLE